MQTAIMSTSGLIADDVVVRRGLRARFESGADLTVAGEACDGPETIELVARPDVRLLAAPGLTNPEIGTRLGISRRTAATHRTNLLRKLGLQGQQDIIRDALKRGLLEL